jgi:transposase
VQSQDIEIWFQDEARIGQRGTLTRMWAEKGTRPRAIRQQQFMYTYLFGAVCPERDVGIGLVLPQVNSEAMKVHLEHISAQIPEGKHGVLVLDRAGWHTSTKLKQFPNLTLLPLPAASPELNPCELVWKALRERHLANRCYQDEEEIVQACCMAWNQFTDTQGAIRSMCTREWAKM